ncbi:MAG: hypothetical protein ACXIVF_15600 [Rhizobiaceae bacterium]
MIAFQPIPGPAETCPRGPADPSAAAGAGRASVAVRMAETMRELAFAGRNVERGALFLEGYSLDEIEAHWEEAAELARRDAVRRVGGDA